MKNWLNPKWIIFVFILPALVLLFLQLDQLKVIRSILDDDESKIWLVLIIGLAALIASNFIYVLIRLLQKKSIHFTYGLIHLIACITYLYFFVLHYDNIIWDIPQWLHTGNFMQYSGSFLMPSIIYSIYILVVHFTKNASNVQGWLSFFLTILIPLVVFGFSQLIAPLWFTHSGSYLGIHATFVLTIFVLVVVFFFLLRSIYILLINKAKNKTTLIVLKILFGLIFPIIGLRLNDGLGDEFGDLSSPWFFILAFLNGALLLLPGPNNVFFRLILFICRSILFAYTVYFALLFLPFLPLSIILIVLLGIGLLMLTPLVLFILHVYELHQDFNYLKDKFNRINMAGLSVLCTLIIPLCFFISFQRDKQVLNNTLDYIYQPEANKEYKINEWAIRRVLDEIQYNKSDSRGFTASRLPFISPIYNKMVMNGLTLSDTKIADIERIMLGYTSENDQWWSQRRQSIVNNNVDIPITDMQTETVYDEGKDIYVSTLHLEITNQSQSNFGEYQTEFTLPVGCYISDYYLYVGDRKEYGILTEKKTALWIYNQITSRQKDPGLLYYIGGRTVAFKVFPFTTNEVRKTGIEFIHKEPISFLFDGNEINFDTEKSFSTVEETNQVIYIPASVKQELPRVERQPYFHFIVNTSHSQKRYKDQLVYSIERLLYDYPELQPNAKISFTNSFTETITLDDNWKVNVNNQDFSGGFFIDRAIQKELVHSTNQEVYPIFVLITYEEAQEVTFVSEELDENGDYKVKTMDKPNWTKLQLENNFRDYQFAFLEQTFYYEMNQLLGKKSLVANSSAVQLVDSIEIMKQNVLQFDYNGITYYLPDDKQPSIVHKTENYTPMNESEKNQTFWQKALALDAMWNNQLINGQSQENWLSLVKASFEMQVMSPVTSFMVVENEAQKEMLLRKQKQVLESKKSLDLGEEVESMDEPIWWVVLLLFFFFCFILNERDKSLIK